MIELANAYFFANSKRKSIYRYSQILVLIIICEVVKYVIYILVANLLIIAKMGRKYNGEGGKNLQKTLPNYVRELTKLLKGEKVA